jgi:Tat protein secretion system quality control protein TatD with DNase activity
LLTCRGPVYFIHVYIDAHFHADDLFAVEPGFTAVYRSIGVLGLASVHDSGGLEATVKALAVAGPYLVSFGIHPQLAVMDQADELARTAAGRRVAAIGECGFDFYGDAPDTVRSADNEKRQREAFEFQLGLAERHGLPIVLHMRRANDLLFGYAKRLSGMRAVILHSWGGPANEALDFLSRCPSALFSFGNSIANGNKKALSSAAALPASAILTETDAPYQPPRGIPDPAAKGERRPLLRGHSNFTDLPRIIGEIASTRGTATQAIEEIVEDNFRKVFADAL